MRKQARHILFGLRVVARTPIGMINRLLQVDQQQDRAIRRICGAAYVAAGASGANRLDSVAGCGAGWTGRCGASLFSICWPSPRGLSL